jgi:glucose/mannose transport system substrate-binding protein
MPREGRLGSTGSSWSRGCRLAIPLFALCLTPGCGADSADAVELEVYNWWLKTSEQEAFMVVKAHHKAAHPNVEIATPANADATLARATSAQKLLLGEPYSTFQANIGADLLRWTMVETWTPDGALGPPKSYLHPIDDIVRPLEDAFWPELLPALKAGRDQHYYGVPINVHRLNVVYYSVDRVAAFAAQNGGDDLFQLRYLCPDPIPPDDFDLGIRIAVGLNDDFVLTLLTFENILPAVASATFYEKLFKGAPDPGWEDTVRDALRCVQYLSRYFTDESEDETWDQAANSVASVNSDATFTVMGDWVNAELEEELDAAEVDSVPFPNTGDIFVFTADTFPVPVQAPHRHEIKQLLRTIASERTQLAFSDEKGSIPALKDAVPSGPRAQETRQAFLGAKNHVLATSGTNPLGFPQATKTATNYIQGLEGYLKALTDKSNPSDTAIEDIITLLRDTLPMLRRWEGLRAAGETSPVTSP